MTNWTLFHFAVVVKISNSVWNGSNLEIRTGGRSEGRKEGRTDMVASQLIRGDAGVAPPDNGLFFTRCFSDTYTHTHTHSVLNTEAPCLGSSCCSCRTIFASYYFITSPFLLPLRPPLLPIYSATLFPSFF